MSVTRGCWAALVVLLLLAAACGGEPAATDDSPTRSAPPLPRVRFPSGTVVTVELAIETDTPWAPPDGARLGSRRP